MQSLLFISLLEFILFALLIYVVSIKKRIKIKLFNASIRNYFIRGNVRLKLNMIYTEKDRKTLEIKEKHKRA